MSLAELIPAIQALSRNEKTQLAQYLNQVLQDEELLEMFKNVKEISIDTPEFAPGSAAILDKLLQEEQQARKCADTSS